MTLALRSLLPSILTVQASLQVDQMKAELEA